MSWIRSILQLPNEENPRSWRGFFVSDYGQNVLVLSRPLCIFMHYYATILCIETEEEGAGYGKPIMEKYRNQTAA